MYFDTHVNLHAEQFQSDLPDGDRACACGRRDAHGDDLRPA